MRTILVTLIACCVAVPARAQHAHSPYAGEETREIKALSAEQLVGLHAGDGLGYALAAELNGVPGPKHVIELADQLQLTEEQRERTRAVLEAMRSRAVELGEQLVEVERRLDEGFSRKTVDDEGLATLLAESARLEGELRLTHLQAHLRMLEILEPGQVESYRHLRDYVSHD